MKLSIVIPVYNNSNFTKQCLEDLSKLSINNEIIIVDNASSDNTKDVVSKFNIIYIMNNENKGFATACNQGYNKSTGDYVLFLNNDIKVISNHEDWPLKLINNCNNGIIGVLSGCYNNKHEPVGEGTYDPNVPGGYLSGWCLCAKKDTWEKLVLKDQLGPWDQNYFLYYEDGDLSFRAKKQGIPLILDAVSVHHYSRVTGRRYNMFHFLRKSKRIFKKKWPNII